MEQKAILIEYGKTKIANWIHDTIFYKIIDDELCMFSDFFDKEINISNLSLYPEIHIAETSSDLTRKICDTITKEKFKIKTKDSITYLKNKRKFSKIIIENQETKQQKILFLLAEKSGPNTIFDYDILKSFGTSDTYNFSVPNQYFYSFINTFKPSDSLQVLDYIGVNDTRYLDIANKLKKNMIAKREEEYYKPIVDLPKEIEFNDFKVWPLDMCTDFDIESLLEHGSVITKTLLKMYYPENYENLFSYDFMLFARLYKDEYITVTAQEKNVYDVCLNTVHKLKIYGNTFDCHTEQDYKFYVFGEYVLCTKGSGWLFIALDNWRDSFSNLHYFKILED